MRNLKLNSLAVFMRAGCHAKPIEARVCKGHYARILRQAQDDNAFFVDHTLNPFVILNVVKNLLKAIGNRYACCLSIILLLACSAFNSNVYAATTPQVLEITGKVGVPLNNKSLLEICKQDHIPVSEIYQWNNHLVIFGMINNIPKLEKQVTTKYSQCAVKIYDHPFYNFNRQERCHAKPAKQWDNIILTANMVRDPKLQAEYLNYHATQFKKWPEVSQGFCNADFQQLLVFKNGRQLMLIISIPKGESLDKLNPLTTKNNPRVDDWNNLMKKYQEGIEGTKKDEVWVFLKPINK